MFKKPELPIFVTEDEYMLRFAEEYVHVFGVYFIYKYRTDKTSIHDPYYGNFENPRSMLAQYCDLPEQHVFYTRSGETISVACDGSVYIDGYSIYCKIWDEEVLLYEQGHIYLAFRELSSHEDGIGIKPMLEQSYVFSAETETSVMQIAFGVEREETLNMLREYGFVVGRSVTISDTISITVLTGSSDYPVEIIYDGRAVFLGAVYNGYFVAPSLLFLEFFCEQCLNLHLKFYRE